MTTSCVPGECVSIGSASLVLGYSRVKRTRAHGLHGPAVIVADGPQRLKAIGYASSCSAPGRRPRLSPAA